MQFSYEEAPATMKSTVSAYWYFTTAIGNGITIIFALNGNIFDRQSHEFLFFAGLMFVAAVIFSVLVYFYKSSARLESD